jgi:signal transduction histidine kinase
LVDDMSGEGGPAQQLQADRGARARVTLFACQERLRAAVQRLALIDPALTAGAQGEERDRNAEIVRELQAAEQAYDALITNIAHDVKTSLTVIRGHAQILARALRRGDTLDPDALLAALKIIDTSAQRMSTELDDWIDATGADP